MVRGETAPRAGQRVIWSRGFEGSQTGPALVESEVVAEHASAGDQLNSVSKGIVDI
jgi:hypothetical protein